MSVNGLYSKGIHMKNKTLWAAVILAAGLLHPSTASSQGTITYLSNLGQPSSGSVSVGANAWYAADFTTGANTGGYFLNKIQLAMNDSSGSPGGLTVMIYTDVVEHGGDFPGMSVASLSGPANPVTAGMYAYMPLSSLTLLPNTVYLVVVTAATTTANGGYEWSVTGNGSPGFNSYHWGGEVEFETSTDGLNWNYAPGAFGQYSLDATPAPEPGTLGLLALGVSLFGLRRWNEKKRS
jgi:PEP-CTERM motif